MKKLYSISLFLTLLIVTGCKKDAVEPAYYVYANAGSDSFKFEGNTYLASSSGSYSKTFILAAYPDANTQLIFTTTAPLTKSSTTLKISYASYYTRANKSYNGSSGLCTITKFDGQTVEGTFYFDASTLVGSKTETIQVKEGRFRLKYT